MDHRRHLVVIVLLFLTDAVGCRFGEREFRFPITPAGPHQTSATSIEYPDVATTIHAEVAAAGPPRTLENPAKLEVWNLPLAEAMQLAMTNSEVIRNLGGSVVVSPAGGQTMFDPALVESNPRSSVEAALSEFDAQLSSSLFWNRVDQGVNQTFTGLFLPVFQQLQSVHQTELAKTTATGAKFSLRHHINYDRTYYPLALRFPSVYNIDYEVEVRQPLLQGAGVEFNRIAGPNSVAGAANGVLLARINTDVSLADFEAGVNALVSDVEQAYWNLYFAYRDLDTKITGRDSALVTWRNIAHRLEIGLKGGTPENEAQLRSQYFTFQAAVDASLGSLYASEERLRYILGLPPNGPQLIRPATEPSTAKIQFAWDSVLSEALLRRVELRRQKWQIKRRELELIAARNFIMPRLDAVALYRWRGLGDELIASPGPTGYESAYQNLVKGDFQDWQMGVQMTVPIGFRQEFTALRNAELNLARENALLREQEFRITHDLSESVRSLQTQFQLMKTNMNRRVAASHEVETLRARLQAGFEQLDVLLQAERRLAESDIAYFRSLVDHALAIRSVHLAKGSLLEYDGIELAEGPWSTTAYRDALHRARHFMPRAIDYGISQPHPISRGPYPQHTGGIIAPAIDGTEELIAPGTDPAEGPAIGPPAQ